jgi:hypothetical protein
MLDATFVAAVLEGIEGTLEELIGRVHPSALGERLDKLHDDTVAVKRAFEEAADACADGGEPAVCGDGL